MKAIEQFFQNNPVAEDFALEHEGEIIRHLDARAYLRAFQSKFRYFLILFPLLVGLLNYVRTSDTIVLGAWVIYSSGIVITAFLMGTDKRYMHRAKYFLEISTGLALIFTAILAGHSEANGIITRGGPIQFAFIVHVANPFWFDRSKLVLRGLLSAVMVYGFAVWFYPAFAGPLVSQILIGMPVSVIITLFLQSAEVQQFYTETLARKQKTQDEKDKAQLSSDNQHAWEQTSRLTYPHQLHMLKLKHNLEDTMNLNRKDALVFEYDIKESSRLRNLPTYDKIKESLFKSLSSEHIHRNYRLSDSWDDHQTPISDGFFLKDMGDGFIATVGHPFKCHDPNFAEVAVEMAENIIRDSRVYFSEHLGKTVQLCIAMEYNEVQGHWKASNVTGFDLTDSSVAPVTRVGSLRRELENQNAIRRDKSQIIVTERVYERLKKKQKHFVKVDLRTVGKDGVKLREKPEDRFIYVFEI